MFLLGKAPPYLSSLVTIATHTHSMRSSRYISLVYPKAKTSLAAFPYSSLLPMTGTNDKNHWSWRLDKINTVLKKVVGIGSTRQLEGWSCDITFLSLSVSTRENNSIVPLRGRPGHISSNFSSGLAWLIPSLMFVILSLKYAANSFHLDVEESSHRFVGVGHQWLKKALSNYSGY
jgi:hypothetical protein